jgi:hypothetical protein
MSPDRLGKPARDLRGAHRRRGARRRQGAHDPRDHLRPRSEHDRGEIRDQRSVIAKDLSGDFGIRRATDIEQKAGVVRLRRCFHVDAEALAEAHRDQRALQAVLEGQAHPEVRRQTQGRDHLRGTDLLAA